MEKEFDLEENTSPDESDKKSEDIFLGYEMNTTEQQLDRIGALLDDVDA